MEEPVRNSVPPLQIVGKIVVRIINTIGQLRVGKRYLKKLNQLNLNWISVSLASWMYGVQVQTEEGV